MSSSTSFNQITEEGALFLEGFFERFQRMRIAQQTRYHSDRIIF